MIPMSLCHMYCHSTATTKLGTILDNAAQGDASEEAIQKQLDEAAKEADGLLAQTTG